MIKFLQRGAVRVARLAPGKAHAVGVVGELLGLVSFKESVFVVNFQNLFSVESPNVTSHGNRF